jgi:hypothetical protein
VRSLATAPYWTAADRAELDVLIDALLGAVAIHRERCRVCSAGGPWCAPLRDCFESVLAWRRTRELRSLAAWLRMRQTLHEQAAA